MKRIKTSGSVEPVLGGSTSSSAFDRAYQSVTPDIEMVEDKTEIQPRAAANLATLWQPLSSDDEPEHYKREYEESDGEKRDF